VLDAIPDNLGNDQSRLFVRPQALLQGMFGSFATLSEDEMAYASGNATACTSVDQYFCATAGSDLRAGRCYFPEEELISARLDSGADSLRTGTISPDLSKLGREG